MGDVHTQVWAMNSHLVLKFCNQEIVYCGIQNKMSTYKVFKNSYKKVS